MTPAARQIRALAAIAGYRGILPLALAAGVDRGTVQRALAGRTHLRAETVDRLARALRVPSSDLAALLAGGARG